MIDEPPITINVGGFFYNLLMMSEMEKMRLRRDLRSVEQSYGYWVTRASKEVGVS